MNNYLKPHEFLKNKNCNTQLPKTLIDTTSRSSESIEEVVKNDSLTEEEMKFFDELQNPDAMKENAKNIISELCKRICNGENPSSNLLNTVIIETVGYDKINPGYIKGILYKLPDWKKIANSFQYDNPNPNKDVEEFRKKRKAYMNGKINPKHTSPDDPIRNETPVNLEPKKEKIKAEYKTISDYNYYDEKSQYFTRTEGLESDIPLLENEDVCIGGLYGGSKRFTKNTKVPYFDTRELYDRKKLQNLGLEYKIGNIFSIYNTKDNVSHILICGNDDDGRSSNGASLMITIKGKISNNDSIELVKYLKTNTNLKFDPFNYNIKDFHSINWTYIQNTIVNYFNNK